MLLFFQAKVPCLPRFWSVMNIFDTSFESDLENCDLEDQISASHKWDSGHERVVLLLLFFRLCDSAKEHKNEKCSEVLVHFCNNTIQYNFIAKCQYTDCTRNVSSARTTRNCLRTFHA